MAARIASRRTVLSIKKPLSLRGIGLESIFLIATFYSSFTFLDASVIRFSLINTAKTHIVDKLKAKILISVDLFTQKR